MSNLSVKSLTGRKSTRYLNQLFLYGYGITFDRLNEKYQFTFRYVKLKVVHSQSSATENPGLQR